MANSRLKEKYQKEVVPVLMKELELKNNFEVPRVSKVVVNMGVGEAIKNKEIMEKAKKDLAAITGQAPSVRRARVSVATFSLRKGMAVGLKVTLRGEKMYSFLDKLFSIVLPRFRDFRGVSRKCFDKAGNYTLGLAEQTVFTEVDIQKSGSRGMEITIVTKSDGRKQSERLLELMGMPFEKIKD
ncbi:MAG TPA: 50S ribosomal protein L5 [Patescibacteria group bacterium]|nr:50S ribosomal protein L5 [Patescibacteria group bacterium]